MCFQMFPKIAFITGCIVTLGAFVAFLHCEFSNVSSNCLQKRMHNHTGCICLPFLHCVFSNGSSNYLYVRMQSHIGCICLAFVHCDLLNEFLNCQYAWMYNHIGCISLTFSFGHFLLLSLDLPHNYLDFDPSLLSSN